MKKTIDLEKHKQNYLQFIDERKTVILSMIDDEGQPFSSCTPFIKKDDKLYVYISKVAEHYYLLDKGGYVDALLIADEQDTKNKFATERARWKCRVRNIGNDGHDDIFLQFNNTYGKSMIDMLRGLDFSLFELTPEQGRYVVGFGMAFDVDIKGDYFIHVVIDKQNK